MLRFLSSRVRLAMDEAAGKNITVESAVSST